MYKLYFHKILYCALHGLATSFINKIKTVQQKVYETMMLYIILLGKVKGYLKNNWVHLRITYLVFVKSVLKYTCILKK